MRILYVGSLAETACSTFYLSALKELGHSVYTYDPKAFQTVGVIESVQLRLTKTPLKRHLRHIQQKLFRLFEETQFDVVFNIAENFLPGFLDEVRTLRSQAPVFIYHSHDNNFSPGILKPSRFFETLAQYDILFTTKSQNVTRYKALGNPNAFYIPSAFEPRVHRPIADSKSKYANRPVPLSFVGTYDYSRDKFLEALGWNELHIWGNNWKRYRAFRQHRDHITPNAVYLDEYADVVSHSKVSLGLLREEAEDLHTQRTFEIPACRSLQLAPRNDEILSYFEEDKEIICFSSPDELRDKAKFYLKNEPLRLAIANAGHERCIKGGHTYLDRVRTMLGFLDFI